MLIAETDGDLAPAFGGAGFYVFDAFHGGEDSFQGRCDFRFDDFGGGAGVMIGNLHGLAPRRRVELDGQEWNDRQSAQPCYGRHRDDPGRRDASSCFTIHYCDRLISRFYYYNYKIIVMSIRLFWWSILSKICSLCGLITVGRVDFKCHTPM